MDKRERSEAMAHALNELWKVHYDLIDTDHMTEAEKRLDKRLETIIRKLYALRSLNNYDQII